MSFLIMNYSFFALFQADFSDKFQMKTVLSKIRSLFAEKKTVFVVFFVLLWYN